MKRVRLGQLSGRFRERLGTESWQHKEVQVLVVESIKTPGGVKVHCSVCAAASSTDVAAAHTPSVQPRIVYKILATLCCNAASLHTGGYRTSYRIIIHYVHHSMYVMNKYYGGICSTLHEDT
ncbi:hypothetical protein [Anaplasma marginale]|uniref:hypothetical protein n=1 Tax=Anaplasma marginale TaxID=770 RepID=UPI0001B46792|nr:hypothetical protein [Anaplasma marginale]